MAHVAKYTAKALGNLVAHYERSRQSTLDRGNVDRARTALNYDLRPSDMVREVRSALLEHERTAGRKARSDAVVMFDWVVTLPVNVPVERSREFFESVTRFVEGRYGAGNVLGAHVHMDEATPHVHVSVLPMMGGKLQASKMVDRADLRTFHEALRGAVTADMGIDAQILLPDSQRALKELSRLPQSEYKLARAELESTSERLESVRRSWEETRGNPLSDIREAREERRLDREIGELERLVELARRRVEELVGRIRQFARERLGREFDMDGEMGREELDAQIQELRDEIAAQVAGELDASDRQAAIDRAESRRARRPVPLPVPEARSAASPAEDMARLQGRAARPGRAPGRGR